MQRPSKKTLALACVGGGVIAAGVGAAHALQPLKLTLLGALARQLLYRSTAEFALTAADLINQAKQAGWAILPDAKIGFAFHYGTFVVVEFEGGVAILAIAADEPFRVIQYKDVTGTLWRFSLEDARVVGISPAGLTQIAFGPSSDTDAV